MCYCVCEAQGSIGKGTKNELGRNEEWKFPVDCCDERDCSEIIPGWWFEYLVDGSECFQKENECELPPFILEGPPNENLCVNHTTEYCIGISSLSSNATITWTTGIGATISPSSSMCGNFTPQRDGPHIISVQVCDRIEGEGQQECCVTEEIQVFVDICDVECYCECKDGNDPDLIIELVHDCNDTRDCQDIFYEDNINDCVKKTR